MNKSETRPGVLSTEFWLVIVANLLVNLGAIDIGGGKYRGLLAIVSVIGYTLSRGLAKQGVPNDPPVIVPVQPADSTGAKVSGLDA